MLGAMNRFSLPVVVVVSWFSVAFASAADTPLTARLDGIAQTAVKRDGFMGAVLVTRAGETLLDRGYGSASLELDVPNTPAMRFRIGSITKQFTAAAVLLLEERGRLRITEPLARYLPEVPATRAPITLYQLLTHTSGLPNMTSLGDFQTWKVQPTSPKQAIERLRDLPLDFAPGEKHAYSNSNYLILGAVIERIADRKYAAFMQDNVFAPLGLRDTDVDNQLDIVPRRAAGYHRFLGTFFNATYTDMSVPHSAGAMYSTTHDLRRWIESLLAGKLLSSATVARMITPEQNGYALGVRVLESPRKVIQHGGAIAGFSAMLSHYPDDQTTIVVLANVTGNVGGMLARRLEKAVFEDRAAR